MPTAFPVRDNSRLDGVQNLATYNLEHGPDLFKQVLSIETGITQHVILFPVVVLHPAGLEPGCALRVAAGIPTHSLSLAFSSIGAKKIIILKVQSYSVVSKMNSM